MNMSALVLHWRSWWARLLGKAGPAVTPPSAVEAVPRPAPAPATATEQAAAADEIGREGIAEEAQGVVTAVGFESFAHFRDRQRLRIVEEHAVITGVHPHAFLYQVMTEVFLGMGVLGRAVFLWPHRDLPEIAVIPHVLTGAF